MKKYCMRCMQSFEKGDTCPKCGEIKPQKKQPHVLLPGTILKDRYLVGYVLGQGGFGITYIGCDMLLNIRVAIKEYYPNGSVNRNIDVSSKVVVTNAAEVQNHEEGKTKFLREAQVLAEFNDEDGVVDVRDYFKENNTAYIVMEYLDGVTLQQCLKHRAITPKMMLKMIQPVVQVLSKVHERQVVHRDISPDNIMVLRNGTLKLMDFGAARQVDFNDQKSLSVVLKTGFAPVEQYQPKGVLGPWTDIYALCATLYVCMTGKLPENSLERVYEDGMKWPSELGVALPNAMEDVLKKGMAVRWKDRYQSMSELQTALEGIRIAVETFEPPVVPVKSEDVPDLEKVVSRALEEKEQEAKSEVWSADEGEYTRTVYVARPKEKQPEPPEQPVTSKPDNTRRKQKQRKNSKTKLIAIMAAIIVVIGAAVGIGLAGKEDKEPTPPSYMTMMGDANRLLQQSGVTGSVASMNVTSSTYNEKFHTYKADCEVIMTDVQDRYVVSLVYDEVGDGWVVNSLSRVQ